MEGKSFQAEKFQSDGKVNTDIYFLIRIPVDSNLFKTNKENFHGKRRAQPANWDSYKHHNIIYGT